MLAETSDNWLRARAHLRQRFSELTDEDLVLVEGREEDLLDAIVEKTGCSRDAVIDSFHAFDLFRAAGGRHP